MRLLHAGGETLRPPADPHARDAWDLEPTPTAARAAQGLIVDLPLRPFGSRLLLLVAGLATAAGVQTVRGGTSAFDLERPWNLAAYAVASLLALSAVLLADLARRPRSAPVVRAPDALVAVFVALLLVLAVDAVAQVHERLGDAASVLRVVVVAPALLGLGLALPRLLRVARGRVLAAAGLALWLAALVPAAAQIGDDSSGKGLRVGEELLELLGASLLALGLLSALQARLRERRADLGGRQARAWLVDLAAASSVRGVALALGLGIAVLGLLGVVQAFFVPIAVFNLDSELTLPAYFSGFLLLLAAGAAVVRAEVRDGGALLWRLLAAFFVFMSFDEVVGLHERLATAAGVYWQVLYLPLVLMGGGAWLLSLRRMRAQPAAAVLFVLGAFAFVLAQALDTLQWSGNVDVPEHRWTTVPEEILEMAGSTLFALAILLSLQLALGRPGPTIHRRISAGGSGPGPRAGSPRPR